MHFFCNVILDNIHYLHRVLIFESYIIFSLSASVFLLPVPFVSLLSSYETEFLKTLNYIHIFSPFICQEYFKKEAVKQFKQSPGFNHEMVEAFDSGFEMFRDYATMVSPNYICWVYFVVLWFTWCHVF